MKRYERLCEATGEQLRQTRIAGTPRKASARGGQGSEGICPDEEALEGLQQKLKMIEDVNY